MCVLMCVYRCNLACDFVMVRVDSPVTVPLSLHACIDIDILFKYRLYLYPSHGMLVAHGRSRYWYTLQNPL